MAEIIVYGAPSCPECRRSKKILSEHRVLYEWVDIDDDAEALRTMEQIQGGGRSIPTVVFQDGSTTRQLGAAVGEGIAALLAVRQHLREHHHLATVELSA